MRSDDGGMSHSVDMALERLIATGVPLSVSVMFPTPWHQETGDSLRRHPDVTVGVRLTRPDTTEFATETRPRRSPRGSATTSVRTT